LGFFQILQHYNSVSVTSFDPPKTIVGKFSACFSMPWTVAYDPQTGSFSMKGSSPGPQETPESKRQDRINARLDGRVLLLFSTSESEECQELQSYIAEIGFDPVCVLLDDQKLVELLTQIDIDDDWDCRNEPKESGLMLVLSPWGFHWIETREDVDQIFLKPRFAVKFD
jgi:hypothetical protein